MLTKKTAVGIGIGSFLIIFGIYFIIQELTSNTHDVNDVVDIGKSDIFQFDTQKHYHEFLNITGSSFHVKMKTSSTGLSVDDDFKNKISFDWVSLENGKHFINITNTGGTTLNVFGKLQAVTDPMIFTTLLISITSGVLITGISAVFSIKKPKGF